MGEVLPGAAKEVPRVGVFELSPEVASASSPTVDAPAWVDLQRRLAGSSQVHLKSLCPRIAGVAGAEVRRVGDEIIRYDRVGLLEGNAATVRAKGVDEKEEAMKRPPVLHFDRQIVIPPKHVRARREAEDAIRPVEEVEYEAKVTAEMQSRN